MQNEMKTKRRNTGIISILTIILLTILPGMNFGQITISSGGYLVNTGYLVLNDMGIASSGTFNSTSGTVTVTGSSNSNIGGGGTTTFYNLTINKTSNDVYLAGNITVNKTLTLTKGKIYTGAACPYNDYKVSFGTGADNPVETNDNRIIGVAYMNARSVGTGALEFLNFDMAAGTDNLGTVSVERKTGNCGVVTYNEKQSISCRWLIVPQNQPVSGRNVIYSWLSALDNGKTFGTTNQGEVWVSQDAITWTKQGNGFDVSLTDPREITVPVTHFSYWVASDKNNPLPVVLTSLSGNASDRNINLNWSTLTEFNNAGFEIQKSSIKNSGQSDWSKIGYVQGNGTKYEQSEYTYTETRCNSGKYKYRLKQIDYNGNFEYFELENTIEVALPTKYELGQNYPNPFNPATKIAFELPEAARVSIILYDMLGREVKRILNEDKDGGYYVIDFNAGDLSSGVYFYRMISGKFVKTLKMSLVK